MMTSVFENFLATLMLMSLPIIIAICLITPEKTNTGYYTNVIEYWTNQQYYCDNFNPAYCKE